MSLRGLFALALEVFLIIMALGSNIREFLISAVCLGGILLFSFVSVLWSVIFLRFTATSPSVVHTREDRVTLTLNVKGLLIFPTICKIKIRPPYNEKTEKTIPLYNAFILSVFKLNRKYDFTLELLHTGHWNLGIKFLRVCDVFGFFVSPLIFTSRKRFSEEISVLPKNHTIECLSKSFNAEKVFEGKSRQSFEIGESFDDSRFFRDGDPLRRIHWKQSAKTGKLFTRLYEKPKEPKTIILIDACTLETKGFCDDIYRETALCLAKHSANAKTQTVLYLLRDSGTWEFSLRDSDRLFALKNELADLEFKKDSLPLCSADIKKERFATANKLFIITSNPDSSVMDLTLGYDHDGVKASLVLAKSSRSSVRFTEDDSGHFAIIENPYEISKKVGKVL